MTKAKSSAATIRDVARLAGVSVATVSRYINGNTPVSAEVAARLEAVMAELNYAPHATARKLATHKTHTLGLALTGIHGDFFAPLLNGIEAVTYEHGYDLLISTTHRPERTRGEGPALRPAAIGRAALGRAALGPHNTDGLLVFSNGLSPAELAHLHERGFPLVLIHQSAPGGLDIPCVTVENQAAAYKIVEHLITVHGRRQIVFLRGPHDEEDAHRREQGYRQALEAHGLAPDPQRILPGEFDRRVAEESIRSLLAAGVPFDAVFAGDDEAAAGVLAALQAAGRQVPEAVSVVGFDDQRMAPYLTPPLTTVRAPTEMVGRRAAEQLVRLIEGRPADSITLLPTEIVLRRSCGCMG